MEDQEIIGLYWARDETAIAETSSKYGKLCFRIANNILANREDSEECVNDTYLGLWNAIPMQRPVRFSVFGGIAGIGRFLLATENATYAILYATDVQFDYTDAVQTAEYNDLMYGCGGMKNSVQVVVHNALPELP